MRVRFPLPAPKMKISEAQAKVHEFIVKKGWNKQPLSVDIAFLAEETGEAAKEALGLEILRKENKTKSYYKKRLAEELSDVLYWILKISARLNIDLEKEFDKKFSKIKKRK